VIYGELFEFLEVENRFVFDVIGHTQFRRASQISLLSEIRIVRNVKLVLKNVFDFATVLDVNRSFGKVCDILRWHPFQNVFVRQTSHLGYDILGSERIGRHNSLAC